MGMVSTGDVYWVELDPTVGSEIQKTCPCLIVSPDDMNRELPRVIIAPITSKGQSLAFGPEVVVNGKMGKIELDTWHDTLIQMFS